jgi:perosamine synthetase
VTAGFGPGDEVITSPFSFVASANVMPYTGATVKFADIDANTLNMDPASVADHVTENTRGLLPVHIFGLAADMDPLTEIARKHDLAIVEDACEALGATYNGRTVGTMGNPVVFAFYANKQMTTAEGGMMVTDDDELAATWRSLINQGRSDSGAWLEHSRIGFNYRLSDVHSAIGLAQVEKLDTILRLRREAAARYDALFADVAGVQVPYQDPGLGRSWFVYWVVLDEGVDRNEAMIRLNERGIQCKPYLPCIHLQPAYRELGFTEGMFPVAEAMSKRTLALPFFCEITEDQQRRVVDGVQEVLAELG